MNISEIAFTYRRAVYLVAAAMMVLGVVSYFSLPAREDPKITIREAVITTLHPGMPAEEVELLISKTLEEEIYAIPEVDEVRSMSREGVSILNVEIDMSYFELDQIWDEMRQKVDAAARDLPPGTLAPIVNDDFGEVAVVTAGLIAPDVSPGRRLDMAQQIRDRLLTLEGASRVDLLGIQDERIYLEYSNARLASLGLSAQDIARTLEAQNTLQSEGSVDIDGRRLALETSGLFDDVDAVRKTLIRLPDGSLRRLDDIVSVARAPVDPPDRTAFVNGKPAIVLAITMTPESNVLDFAPRVRSELETIETELPAGFTIEILTYQADQVASAVYGVSINVLQTLAIVLVVVIVFLGLRTGLIVGSIVPGVMLATIAVMGFLDLPIERMSLATLVIALGLLVDNGIVIAEDFKRRLEEGYSRQEALSIGGRELAAPLLISSLTTILVFIPLMLADHSSGEYTRSISLLILISLLTSWVFALMVTPLLCHAFIKEPAGSDSARSGNAGNAGQPASDGLSGWLFNTMNSLYERGLRAMMRMRAVFLAVIGLAMAAAAFGMSQAPQSFFPNSDRTEILVYLDLPADASPRRTDVLVQSVLQTLDDNERFPYLETTAGYAGFGGPRFVLSLTPIDPEPNKAFLVLNVDRRENLEPAQRDIRQMLAEDYPEAWASVTDMFLGPSDSRILEIQAIGPDPSVILDAGEEIAAAIDAIPNTRDIRSNWATPTVNLNVQIDQARARRANVSTVEIAQALSTFFDGQPVSRLYDGDEIVPITMRAQDSERFEPERLESLAIRSPAGGSVLLGEVAEIEVTSVLSRIHREDLVRTLTVEARHDTLTAEELAPMLSDDLKAINADLPPNHRVEVDGIVVDAQEGRSALAANIPLALGLIVLLLVIQFRSYRRPAIILLTIPLILIGAVVGLYALQADFGFMPLLGMYALAGIIVNNAIVLIDRIDIERGETPDDEFDAIIRASVRRFRPILMTTLTTLAGLSPLIIAQDVLFYGMAAVISGGLLVGTVLTLGVVPVLYSYFFRINANRRTTRADESAGPA